MLSRKSFNAIAAACVMSLGFSSATAQTVANGPYYATPSWDQTLPAATRFIVLSNMASNAVLDRESGLVWERSPGWSAKTWNGAKAHCQSLVVGNRKGWRLPMIEELGTLVDPSMQNPALPTGHPFSFYLNSPPLVWSATAAADDSIAAPRFAAWAADFTIGSLRLPFFQHDNSQVSTWCVRGGRGIEVQ